MPRGFRDEDDDSDSTAQFNDVRATAATAKALLCVVGGEEHWVPRSQIHDNSEVYEKGHEGKLVVTAWWADKAGLK
jgi:hypothetical protein